MAYPVWITPPGDLGKIQALQFFEVGLTAVDPNGDPNGADVTYSVVSGKLPPGLQLDSSGQVTGNPKDKYSLDGVPFIVDKDRTFNFSVRARSTDGKITDRSFVITVTGNFAPQLLTSNFVPLGTFLDGSEISLQLNAVDLNNDALTWKVINGTLPPGLNLTQTGQITGILKPNVTNNLNLVPGWDESKWQAGSWQFKTIAGNFVYQFTVQVSDSKSFDEKNYRIIVYAHDDVRADNDGITIDNSSLTTDLIDSRIPIILTKDMGDYASFVSGNYFSYKFDAVDYDSVPVGYSVVGTAGTGWDANVGSSGVSQWDLDVWDVSPFGLPPGLTLDVNTGWLTGFVPEFPGPEYGDLSSYTFVASGGNYAYDGTTGNYVPVFPGTGNYNLTINNYSKTYSFGLQVYNVFDTNIVSDIRYYYITILGAIDLRVNWLTPADLGVLDTGSVSQLQVQATAPSNRELYYSLQNGSKLPQGLVLLQDGNISGRCSFQTFSLDQGTTTFDVTNTANGVYKSATTLDQTYTFTIIAQDYSANVVGSRTFSLRLNVVTYEPYNDLYIRCLPSVDKRDIINQIMGNTDYFPYEDVYRIDDPWWGLQKDINILVGYGLTSSQASSYALAMRKRHYDKKFYFGDYKYAEARDVNGNHLYDVVYVDLLEDTKTYSTTNAHVVKNIPNSEFNMNNIVGTWRNPRARSLQENTLTSDLSTISADALFVRTNDGYYPINPLNIVYPNDLDLMLDDIIMAVGNTNTNTLPQWQTSIQPDGQILGFQTAAVLAYLKPGTGAKALYKIKTHAPQDIKLIPFQVDRYVLDNNQDINFDLNTGKWIGKAYTTFDSANKPPIQPSYTVDFAVDLPFSVINNSSILPLGQLQGWESNYWDQETTFWDAVAVSNEQYFAELNIVRINDLGGLDGTITDYDNKLIIFSTQENFANYPALLYDGWIDNGDAIPGYLEKSLGQYPINKRGGIWRINVVSNLLRLTFVEEVQVNQVVSVRFGNKAGKNYQYSSSSVGISGQTVPKYSYLPVSYVQIGTPTTFDNKKTLFINNKDQYTTPFTNDKYIKFPKIGVFNYV
jgi:Putative Ig domain